MRKCCDCNIMKPINEFQKGKWRCKVCEWLRLNSHKLNDEYSLQQYTLILDNIINLKIKYINELVDIVGINLENLISLFHNKLKIGNKPIRILWNCDQCNKEMIFHPCKFILNENVFCSHKCYGTHKKENMLLGEDNPCYNRVKTNCTNCNKEISVIPHNYNKVNSFGDNHNFCSHDCYLEYRKTYYIKEKSVMHNYVFTEEQIDKARQITVNLYEKGVFGNNTNTKPQLKINTILDSSNIIYQREKGFKYYNVDNYLNDYNLIIEVMGDYFHSNPNKYKLNSLNEMQRKGVSRDKSKRTYIKKYYNISILYLWEIDINTNIELCEKLILEYINNNGVLENYNSFNYFLDEYNKLKLKNKIISPYFELSNKNP